jgi:hypothetical protein
LGIPRRDQGQIVRAVLHHQADRREPASACRSVMTS